VRKLVKFRQAFRRCLYFIQLPIFVFGVFECYVVVLLNGAIHFSVSEIIFWFAIYSVLAFTYFHCKYWLFSKFSSQFSLLKAILLTVQYILLASRYIRIRQQSLLSQLIHLIQTQLFRPKLNHKLTLRLFLCIQRRLCSICRDLHAYQLYWGPHFSTLYFIYIVLECNCVYVLVFIGPSSIGWIAMSIFGFSLLECILLQFYSTHQFAGNVRYGGRFERFNQRFALQLVRVEGRSLPVSSLLKVCARCLSS